MYVSDQPWWVNLRIVCTDRGAHPSREIAVVHVDQDGSMGPSNHGRYRGGVAEWTDRVMTARTAGGVSWRLPCPTCGRDVQLTGERMRKLAAGLVDAHKPDPGGVLILDVSHLPASML